MNLRLNRSQAQPGQNARRAFTLIEMVGVLTIMVILAVALLPALIKSTDQLVANQEAATLQFFNNALHRSIQRNGYVPGTTGTTNWAYTLATELGMNVSDVATNVRHQPRFFLVDPNLNIDGHGLPYVQDANGATNVPVNPRVIILSSLGVPFTASMVSGVPSAADFNNLWNAADGQLPSASVSLLNGWKGAGSDLAVKRINLSPDFVHLVLYYYGSTRPAYYTIETNAAPTPVTGAAGLDAYLIKSSILDLFSSTNLDSRQILNSDGSFVFYADAWRSLLAASDGGNLGTNGLSVTSSFYALASSFLASPSATNALNAQPSIILSNFVGYMSNYNQWAASGFATNSAAYRLATNYYFSFSFGLVNVEKALGLSTGTPK